MKTKRILFILSLFLSVSLFTSAQTDCKQLPTSFATYEEAISKVKAAKFKINETINTERSSWIRGLSYYSCDGTTGFLIMKTDKKEYIHTGVPYTLWQDFKKASSLGSFYDLNVKHKYHLDVGR